jgi:DNA helicase HerA-like ATPase
MTDAAAQVEAAKKALAQAEAALAAEKAAATPAPATAPTVAEDAPLGAAEVTTIKAGYTFDALALEMGALVNGEPLAGVPIRIPIAMLNRHGLVAGATGTGKTKTLQVLAEQLSAAGVPVFAADIKGDLSGIATAGVPDPKLLARTQSIGQKWAGVASPTEYYTLGGEGIGVPIRATVTSFGPLLLSKVLGLNATQESSLGLVFHYADAAGLPLVDLSDLRAVLSYLVSDEGKPELKDLGGLSGATAGVILRELIGFADQGADVFFGEPEMETAEFLKVGADGRGIVSLLEIPGVQDRPALFSTFLMWLLADLFNDLPEVGDIDKPKLVFFFDEAHLLFKDSSKDFIAAITQTVRLIRSKGVGIFFVTQTPKDVPNDVLAQIGSRVQHQLRAHTPDDARALKATVSTYPISGYNLAEVLTSLSIGEAIVTVMNEQGAPSPVAWTRLRAPQGSMAPTPAPQMQATVDASPLLARYGTAIDPESAREILAKKINAAASATTVDDTAKIQAEYDKAVRDMQGGPRPKATTTRTSSSRSTARASKPDNPIADILGSRTGQTIVREVLRGIFSTLKRK